MTGKDRRKAFVAIGYAGIQAQKSEGRLPRPLQSQQASDQIGQIDSFQIKDLFIAARALISDVQPKMMQQAAACPRIIQGKDRPQDCANSWFTVSLCRWLHMPTTRSECAISANTT